MLYLTVLAGCGIFYIAYGEWLSFLILVAVLGLPWLSLLLSLPAMLRFRAAPAGPEIMEMGESPELWLLGTCPLPMPPFRGRLALHRHFSGHTLEYQETMPELAAHCGGYTITAEKVRICDYLGLFSLPVLKKDSHRLLIRPRPVPVSLNDDLHRHLARAWRPKFGGGFAENHELRLYRPGDSLNQVHWKLSAKTGQLMLRQPMEPQRGLVLLTMNLRGTPEELDRKLGRLLWLSNHLTEQGIAHEARVLTEDGVLSFSISDPGDAVKTIDTLLCQKNAAQGDLRSHGYHASWQYHIGGDADEV